VEIVGSGARGGEESESCGDKAGKGGNILN